MQNIFLTNIVMCMLQERQGTPAHSPEAMQEVASAVASVLSLSNSEQEVLAMLQRSAYGKQQDPLPLPDTAQARCLFCAHSSPFIVLQPGHACPVQS